MGAAAAGQARHLFFVVAHGDAEKVGDHLVRFCSVDRTFARIGAAVDQRLRELTAACRTAGAAVGVGQHLVHLIDARVFEHIETTVGEGEQGRQRHPEGGHECTGCGDV